MEGRGWGAGETLSLSQTGAGRGAGGGGVGSRFHMGGGRMGGGRLSLSQRPNWRGTPNRLIMVGLENEARWSEQTDCIHWFQLKYLFGVPFSVVHGCPTNGLTLVKAVL